MSSTHRLRPFTTMLIGGVVFLLPLIVTLLVVGQALALAVGIVEPVVALLPFRHVAGVAVATVGAVGLVLLVCLGAGLAARGAFARALSSRFEDKLSTLYPRYLVFKAMAQGLHGAIGQRVLNPVLVSFDDHQLVAYEIERLADGRVVLFLPSAPDVWAGSVVVVAPERVEALGADAAALSRSMKGLGHGLAGQLAGTRPHIGA